MSRRRATQLALAAFAAAIPLSATAAAPAHAWQCESSALRGTVLGTALEPVTANRGTDACRTASAGLSTPIAALPLPLDLNLLAAQTSLVGPPGDVRAQQAGAAGGIGELRVRALPELPLQIPLPDLGELGAVAVPGLGITVDLREALRALLPDGRLPNVDLVRVRALQASAVAGCANGRPDLRGSSSVTGVTVLGQELPVDQVVERSVSLVDSENVDPSDIDVSRVVLPAGVSVPLPVLQTALQPILDGLPEIPIPAAVARVKLTPAEQARDATSLTQRALRVEIGVLGQPLADLVVGEAIVRSSGVDCAVQSTADLALQCTTRKLVLTDVVRSGRRVRLTGFADQRYVGRRVALELRGRRVATARVRQNGRFAATAALPPRSIRTTNLARYRARIGRERSLRLKLVRRMRVTGLSASRNRIVIRGRVSRPLARPARRIEIRQRISCRRWRVVGRVRPKRDGTFRVTVPGPPQARAVVYRLATRVRKNTRNPKTFPTFTLPRYVDLG